VFELGDLFYLDKILCKIIFIYQEETNQKKKKSKSYRTIRGGKIIIKASFCCNKVLELMSVEERGKKDTEEIMGDISAEKDKEDQNVLQINEQKRGLGTALGK